MLLKKEVKTFDPKDSKICIPQRYVIGILGFLALTTGYIQRFHTGLTITEMTHPIYHNPNDTGECPGSFRPRNSSIEKPYEFDWDEETQGLILGSFFWGYVITQIPGGHIAERYGAKHTLGIGMLFSIIGNLITPFVVRNTGYIGFIVIRFLIGIGQGPLYPSVNVLLSNWAPLNERGRLGAVVFAGAQIGNVISMGATGFLIRQFDWTMVFYVYGTIGIIWYFLWLLLVSDTPNKNNFISEVEKKFLAENVQNITSVRKNLPPTPWKKILSSTRVWGLVAAQIGHDWGLFTIATDLPKYMKQVLHFSVAQNGVLSAIPHLTMWISALISGVVVDYLIKKKIFSVTVVRKIFVTIAATGPAIGIMAASYSGCDHILVVIWFTIGMGLMGAFVPSLKVNPLDLSPNFAGSLMALVGGVGALSGIVSPSVVGALTTHGTLIEWRQAFWVVCAMLIGTNVIYLIFGTGKVQIWNDVNAVDDEEVQRTIKTTHSYTDMNEKISVS